MYSFYINKMLLPVPPSKLSIKINNKNKTMTLINDGEINILKTAGLSEVSFDFLLPNVKYPFAKYKSNRFRYAEYYLNKLESLKRNNEPFRFMIVREMQNGDELFDTNMRVSLEDYSIVEDASDGVNITVSIKLKQYKSYGTKSIVIIEPVQSVVATTTTTQTITVAPPVEARTVETTPMPQTYTVVEGDCLWNICKQYLGDGSKCYEIATLNGISNPNLIYPGQVITLG